MATPTLTLALMNHKALHVMYAGSWDITSWCVVKTQR
jgi:hypothetical protein